MYIFKNALRSISRSRGRNILIGIIVLVIAISSCVALSIRQAADDVRETTLETLEITASISVDRTAMMQNFNKDSTTSSGGGSFDRSKFSEMMNAASSLSLEKMLTYSKLSSVKDFYYTMTASFDETDAFLAVDTTGTDDTSASDTSSDTSAAGEDIMEKGPMGGRQFMIQGDFTCIGYSSDSAMTGFLNGTCSVTSGSMFTEGTSDMVCVISDELATYNSLDVNDTITICNPNDAEETYTLTVVGIYHNEQSTVTSSSVMGAFSASSDPANYIYTSYNTLAAITAKSSANATTTTDEETGRTTTTALSNQTAGTYVFATAEDYALFEEQAGDAGLSDSYKISSANLTDFENSIEPLSNLSKISLYFLIVVFIIGGIILVVLNIFNIRERKYEIGVLTAIGMKKPKVALQFITEIFAVMLLSITIGAVTGAAISVPVANKLLESQIESAEQTEASQTQTFGRQMGGMQAPDGVSMSAPTAATGNNFFGKQVNYIKTITSATNWVVILELFAIGIALTLIASCAAVAFIMRYEPLKILSNRD